MNIKRWMVSLLFVMPLLANAESPNAVIEEAVAILDKELTERRDELESDDAALYALVDEILLPRFDRRFSAKQALGKHWRTATPEQQDAFVIGFYRNLVHRYSDGLLKFDQGKIEVKPYRGDETKKYTKVKTIVTIDGGTKVPVDYMLINRETGWLMIDVIIEGISYLQTTKEELKAEISRSSLDAVIERLQRENAGVS
jgi:phospholipid transport system substrate-binding protein